MVRALRFSLALVDYVLHARKVPLASGPTGERVAIEPLGHPQVQCRWSTLSLHPVPMENTTMTTDTEYFAPMTFEDAVKALDECGDDCHDLDEDVAFAFDDMEGYEEAIVYILRQHFGYDEHPEHSDYFRERMQEAHHETGILQHSTIDEGPYAGQPITAMNLFRQLQDCPAIQEVNAEVQTAVANLRAAQHAFNEVWARKLMAEHKAAWQRGVEDAVPKYAPLLADLFVDEAA
jgi:hypothetical protein